MQINGGANNMFAAWADAGGMTMGYFMPQPESRSAAMELGTAIRAGG